MTGWLHHYGDDPFEPILEDRRGESVYIHESSYVDAPCHIGDNTSILHFSHIMANAIIGSHCLIGHHVTVGSGVMIGNHVRVMHNTLLTSGVILEDEVYCGPSTIFADSRHVRADVRGMSRISPTVVRRGTTLGPNTTVASGALVGRFAFVEAGTVIDRNVPDFAVVYGNPLKFGGWQCACGKPLQMKRDAQEEAQCGYCNKRYSLKAKWKLVQLTEGPVARDTDSQPDPSVRAAQGRD